MHHEEPLFRRSSLFVLRVCMCLYAVFFFLVTTWHPLTPQRIFDSPDETANAFFIARIAASQSMGAPNPSVDILGAEGAPRSQRVVNGVLVPEGFPGLAYYWGLAARFITMTGVLYIVPLLALVGLYAWYGIVKFFFNQKIAGIAFLVLGFFPPFLYWSSRVLMPNSPVLSCVLIGVWASLQAWKCRKFSLSLEGEEETTLNMENPHTRFSRVRGTFFLVIAGVSFGMAIAVRPSELLWVLPIMVIAIGAQCMRARWYTVVCVSTCLAVVFPVLGVHRELYGAFLASGYAHGGAVLSPDNGVVLAMRYFGEGYLWLSVTSIGGILMAIFTSLRHRTAASLRVLLCVLMTVTTACAVMVLYGDQSHQEFLPGIRFVSESHTRYFLPLYVFMTVWAAYGLAGLSVRASSSLMKTATPLIVLMVCGGLVAGLINPGGIFFYKSAIERNADTRDALLAIIPSNALVVGAHAEKFVFPLRNVSQYYDNPRVVERLAHEIEKQKTPVYIVDTIAPQNIRQTALLYASYGLRVTLDKEVTPGLWVYNVNAGKL